MKKSYKLISVLLAIVMVVSSLSAGVSAFAADTYKPLYSDKVTEEDVSLMLGDVNTLLQNEVLTGDTIEEIWKMLPALSAVLMYDGSSTKASDKAEFYKISDPEFFAELPDGDIIDDVVDENGVVTQKGTLTTYFETHPIVCENAEDFQTELNKIVDAVIIENLMSTVVFAFAFGGDVTAAKELASGLDEICKAIGVEQEKTANEVIGFDTFVSDIEGTRTYIKNIIAAILPDASNNVMSILQNITDDTNGALLYSGISKVINNLSGVLNSLSGTLAGLGVDLTDIIATIDGIKDTFNSLPTLGEEADKRLDIEGTITTLIMSLTDNALAIDFVDDGEEPSVPGATVTLGFRHMDLTRVKNAESTADVVKTVYDYLYDNLIANENNNELIALAIRMNIIDAALGITIPQDIKDFILSALEMENLELADELIVMLADVVGREIPTDPEEPTTDPSEPSTKPTDPTEPSNPDDSKETTKPSTTKPSTNKPVTGNPSIPDTGRAPVVGYTLVALAAFAGLVMVMCFAKSKKVKE